MSSRQVISSVLRRNYATSEKLINIKAPSYPVRGQDVPDWAPKGRPVWKAHDSLKDYKDSSDLPWAIGGAIFTVLGLYYVTIPYFKKEDHDEHH